MIFLCREHHISSPNGPLAAASAQSHTAGPRISFHAQVPKLKPFNQSAAFYPHETPLSRDIFVRILETCVIAHNVYELLLLFK
jgi:hypothetical protein